MARQTKNDLSATEDIYLASQAKEGDEAAFSQLFDKHYNWVYSKAYRILKDHQDTEEVSLDVFTKVWRELQNEKWDPKKGSFQAWLNIVARNTTIDAIRKRDRIRESLLTLEEQDDLPLNEYEDGKPGPDKHIIAQEAQEILEKALEQVTKPNHRIAWILRHLEGCSVAEISRILNRKDGTVKIWIFRCTQELRQILVNKGIRWIQ
ncbi:RNA polymerase sigma factor [Candidatus Poribacteria bacterium]|nr:RNA polymerase sigma factor [Candidatus Poribacteria bacterium]